MSSVIAWAALPAIFLVVCGGLGALLRRLSGLPLPAPLLVPLGAALAVILALTGYSVGLRGLLTPLVIVALAVAGLVLAARGRGSGFASGPAGELQPANEAVEASEANGDGALTRLRRAGLPQLGYTALLWAVVYGLYMAPVILTGHWTWPGYNFVNDTAVQLVIADWLPQHGRSLPSERGISTTTDVLITYIEGGYPLGGHALLAALAALIPVGAAELYHPFVAAFAATAAVAFMALARTVVSVRWAAFAGLVAVANNLFYQYALQGNMKEVVTGALLATTAAVAAWSLTWLRDEHKAEPALASARARRRILIVSAALLAVPVGATVNALSVAGAPYVLLIVALWLGLVLVHRLVLDVRALAFAVAVGAVALLVTTATTVPRLLTWGKTTSDTFATPEMINELGHLARPLELRQTVGIWLIGDYRFAPVGASAGLTTLGVLFAIGLAVAGVIWLLQRRRFSVFLFAVPVILVMALVVPRVSPYADAKTLMLAAPAVTLLAGLGAAALARWRPPIGMAAGALLLGGVLASDALAYHSVKIAPSDRMESLEDIDRRLDQDRDLALVNEPEEFAKVFLDDTRINASTEAITPAQVELRVPQGFGNLYFDLDEQQLQYVTRFPTIVLRRSPATSRPPAGYERTYANQHYVVWRRDAPTRVSEHLPQQGIYEVAGEPACGDVLALARRADAAGEVLVASPAPTLLELDTLEAQRSPSWIPHPFRPRAVLTEAPGEAVQDVNTTRPGRYRAWVAGSFGRPVSAFVDGRRIGSAGGVDNVGQWHEVGTVELAAGEHTLRIARPGGDLSPGDGYAGELGPLVLERIEPRPLQRVDPSLARTALCGKRWDWIERVRP